MVHSMTLRINIYYIFLLFGNAFGLYETAPHIIVFMADDLGWYDVGFHGSDEIPTPNIDALAYNGIILNRHYVLPSSTPSRTAFFTGKYPIHLGMQGEDIQGGEPRGLPLNVKILPEHLQGLGYTTNLIGKWHLGYHTLQHTPSYRGFDYFCGFYNSHVSYHDYKYSYQNMSGYDMHCGDAPAYGLNDKYVTDLFTDKAVKIIENHDSFRPLYLQISHLAVHAPLENPQDYDHSDRRFIHIREQHRRKYARMVSKLDDSVGRIVHTLGNRGMLRDSLILFLTDNGAAPIGKFRNFGSNYPLRGMKYTLYEGGVRGVSVLWSPRLNKPARVCDNLIHISDWLPTLYAAADGDLSDLGEIDGVDQWRMLNDGHPIVRDKLLLNIDEISKTEGAIYKHYKLLRGSIEGGIYDGHHRDSYDYDRNFKHSFYNDTKWKATQENVPSYTDTIKKSVVSESITHFLGDPVTQPSTIAHLRQEAERVSCQTTTTYGNNFFTCNVTECLFDIKADPCETKNIVHQYPRIARELDQILEHYGHYVRMQVKTPVDWFHADPRRTNNTWEPWLPTDNTYYPYYNTAVQLAGLAYYLHIGIVLVTVVCKAFV
ncbi:LOW QUALITY PROTEIN: arylsulfatase B [Solenopsis invicta]|uniref:LOW QUALITY PROTEIN: arylsulfatase B n=1 Tax=Solenopsis invicta TaxID=13686 RepID=UPI00193E7CA0|nr:LOW QUALITY PROTEIN: arylsulfatase B [Solenopsis invicta]